MTGLEYQNTICPTTSRGKDPNREDVADAFEDGIAEGAKLRWKPSEEQMEALLNAEGLVRAYNYPENAKILASLYEQLKKLM